MSGHCVAVSPAELFLGLPSVPKVLLLASQLKVVGVAVASLRGNKETGLS